MLSDTAKLIYGYDEFLPQRKKYLEKLKNIHGYSIIEFLNYLIRRDRYVDETGFQSDLILLHYKMSSNSFIVKQPQVEAQQMRETQKAPQITESEQKPSQNSTQLDSKTISLSHSELLKLDIGERSRILREMKKRKIVEQKEESARIPTEWPLLKEERLGESSEDDKELSPSEFSQLLVGGRNG